MTPKEVLLTVLSEDDADDVIEYRRVTIKKPLTTRGAKQIAKQMALFGDPARAVEIMISRCWRGFEAEWVHERPTRTGNGLVDSMMRRMQ